MKFAKELDENAIPEWKDKYFDYKGAKKKLKAVARAARNADRSSPLARRSPFGNTSSVRDAPVYSFLTREGGARKDVDVQDDNRQHPLRSERQARSPQHSKGDDGERTPRQRGMPITNERSPLRTDERGEGAPRLARYGSIIGSPPSGNSPLPDLTPQTTKASLLELPDPALNPARSKDDSNGSPLGPSATGDSHFSLDSPDTSQLHHPDSTRRQFAHTGNAYEIGQPTDEQAPAKKNVLRHASFFLPKRSTSVPDPSGPRPLMQRILSVGNAPVPSPAPPQQNDVALESYREVDFRQAEFFLFLDKQLDKIEDFYKAKEDEATARLGVLREQLHVLRNRRLEDIMAEEAKKHHQQLHQEQHHSQHDVSGRPSLENAAGRISWAPAINPFKRWTSDGGADENEDNDNASGNEPPENGDIEQNNHNHRWASVADTISHVRPNHIGKTSKAMKELGTPPNNQFQLNPSNQDYTRRRVKETIPAYHAAKRKLKTALQEYYRGLELLKSYALLNRTAFRKINKKFDKTVNMPSGSTQRYMSEKVNKSHFVNSDVIDGHIQAIEDLYARYFERGNRKVAIGKLRGKVLKLGDYTGALCRAGFLLGSGIVLGVQGLVYGILDLYDGDPAIETYASYLLQIYAGYFLFLFLVGLFCIDARIFSRMKVNYQFVFEFDARHMLDWRQLSEIPSVFFFLLALTMYLNFTARIGGETMYIFWPVILVGVSIILMFLPPPVFYWDARRWFLYSLWRLCLPVYYPVEFRDFFLGDMFCSQTYAMGNIELFFCLYAQHWNPDRLPTCSSSSSRTLGFLSTLPGIIRALQCIRRYWDTRNFFPHLVNCGKYMFTIAQYATLSIWRIDKNGGTKALFITCATINALYCSVWDVMMDWSLGDGSSKHFFLRNTLAYKRHKWWYYAAIVIDPILRFNWVFYVIFADDVQHSSIISFSVAFSEVCRRGIWTVFRVENEHCTNVSRNRAARDVDLPYQRTSDELLPTEFDGTGVGAAEDAPTDAPGGVDEESAMQTATSSGPSQPYRTTSHTTGRAEAPTPSSASFLRLRKQATESPVTQALKRVGSTMAAAHAQDYEKKRKPFQQTQGSRESDEDDDDEDEDETEEREAEELRDRADRAR